MRYCIVIAICELNIEHMTSSHLAILYLSIVKIEMEIENTILYTILFITEM